MSQKNCFKYSLSVVAMAAVIAYAPAGNAAIVSYSQDFEGLAIDNSLALGFAGDGYAIFADVWLDAVGGTKMYEYGPFSAPNGGEGFSAIATGEGGPSQGAQYLNIYSDYANADHGTGLIINTSVFQEQTIGAGDIGSIWTFSGDYKSPFTGGIAEPTNPTTGDPNESTANAFIVTLDPGAGYNATNIIRFDTTAASNTDWASFAISIDLSDPALEGQILQFGFNTTASDYDPSGVYYDNLNFSAVPVPAAVWLFGSGLLGLVGVARRRKS